MVDIANIATNALTSYQAGQEDRQRRVQQNALDEAGRLYSGGNFEDAENALISAGLPEVAGQYSALAEARRARGTRTRVAQAMQEAPTGDMAAQTQAGASAALQGDNPDPDEALRLGQLHMQLDSQQRQQAALAHDAVASFALGQIQRGVPVAQRQADALAHAPDFSQQTGIPVQQVQQMVQSQTDWSDNGLKAIAASHRSASDQLSEMQRETEFQESQAAQRAGRNGSFQLDPQSQQDLSVPVAMGAHVYDVTGSRNWDANGPILNAAMALRRRLHLSPDDLAATQMAYRGSMTSFAHLQQTRDNVTANEGAARSALANLSRLQQALPRDQITQVPLENDALQAVNSRLRGQGPLGAYVGALVTARMEAARVISGSNSPPVEAMHEAQQILPNNITPQALAQVSQNIDRELQFRTQAYDQTLNDIRQRISQGLITPDAPIPGATSTPATPPNAGAPAPSAAPTPTAQRWAPGQPIPAGAVQRLRQDPSLAAEFERTFHLAAGASRQYLQSPVGQGQSAAPLAGSFR